MRHVNLIAGNAVGRPRRSGLLRLLAGALAVAAMFLLAVPAQAAISYVGTGPTATSTGTNSRSLVVPTILDNDVLIAHVAVRGNRTITPPAGWTLIDQVYVSNNRITQGVYYKVGLASDSGTTVTWNFNNSDDNAGVIRAYRGVDTAAPIGNYSGNINGGNSSSTLTAQSITTTVANEWIMTFYGAADGRASPFSTPGGMTERYDFDNGGGNNGLALAGDDDTQTTSGATGNKTSNSSRSDRYVAQLVALKPISFPTVSSITRANPDPTSVGTAVSWTVVFSTSVTGVDATDFTLVQAGGVSGASITSVSGSGATWTVNANTGSGTGTLGLNLVDDDSINASGQPLGGAGAGNGDYTGQIYTVSGPAVTSIDRASANPTFSGNAVSWTVTFNKSVTGVDATDFALVQAGGVSGASITSVSGSGATWTVTANDGTGSGTLGLNLVDDDTIVDAGGSPLGGSGAGNGDFTGQVYTISLCPPPSNIPAGVTVSCVCDNFGRTSLNPSTIFGGNWTVSLGSTDATGILPRIVNPGYLRLTENTANNAKAATVPGIFPAAGNYISVEFNHYAYGSTSNPGADGIAVTLSDYSVPAVPGGFGGSLGYAQRSDGTQPPGFNGGWVGIALDEYGNYQSSTEGRVLGACGTAACLPQSVGVRGPGSGANGYRWIGGTGSNPGGLSIDNRTSGTPAPGYMYQVIVDARNYSSGTVNVSVNRDATTKDGSNYTPLFGPFNSYPEANYAMSQGWISKIVPDYWKISFTGSTGGANDIHEIGGLRICAQSVYPPTGGVASGFSAIDEAYPAAPPSTVPAYQNFQTGDIYMKLMGSSFKLWVAALTDTGISTGYSSTSNKYVSVKLVDNSDNACGTDSARTCNAACTNKPAVETGGSQIATFPAGSNTGAASPSPTFTLNSAWKNLIAVMKECTTSACTAFTATAPACSADSFSVRPASFTSVSSANATYGGTTSSAPVLIAGDPFSLTATSSGVGSNPGGYTGVPKINSASVQAVSPATVAGTLAGTFSAATSGAGSSTATGAAFTYSEVGIFRLRGPDFTVPRIPGIYDDIWTAIDSDPSKNDCNSGTSAAAYSNTKDASGKYGCNFGITADTTSFGRFTPAYFDVILTPGCSAGNFTYSGQPFLVTAMAYNAAGVTTQNYDSGGGSGFAKDVTISSPGNPNDFNGNVMAGASRFTLGSGSTYPITNSLTGPSPPITYTFPVKETPPLTPSVSPAPPATPLRATDTDNVSSLNHVEPQIDIRSGRVHLYNAYGSELLDLPMAMRVEYYSGTADGWLIHSADTCSGVSLSAFSNYQGNLNAGETCVQDTGNPGVSGQGCSTAGPLVPVNEHYYALPSSGGYNLYLKNPGAGNEGSVDVTADLSTKPWLRFDWDGDPLTADQDPTGKATFGLYRGSPRNIYLRERY